MGNTDHGTAYMRGGGDDVEFQPWHYMYVYSIEMRLIMRVRYHRRPTDGVLEGHVLLRIRLESIRKMLARATDTGHSC